MANIKIEQSNNLTETKPAKLLGGLVVGSLVVVVGITAIRHNSQPQTPSINEPHREYVVKANDTEAGILQRAYPDKDWRTITGVVEGQMPQEDKADHILRPGEILSFDMDAHIGKPVEASSETPSVSVG